MPLLPSDSRLESLFFLFHSHLQKPLNLLLLLLPFKGLHNNLFDPFSNPLLKLAQLLHRNRTLPEPLPFQLIDIAPVQPLRLHRATSVAVSLVSHGGYTPCVLLALLAVRFRVARDQNRGQIARFTHVWSPGWGSSHNVVLAVVVD